MSYSDLATVRQAFDAEFWDPATDSPGAAAVTAWLADWSGVVDGQIASVVAVPVAASTSPVLYGLCRQIVTLLVRADVYDAKWPTKPSEEVSTRQSQVWRKQAQELIKSIQAGLSADGEPAAEAGGGVPIGDFGGVTGPIREREW